MNLLTRAKQYAEGAETILEWLGKGAETVTKDLAQSRCNVCLRCPMNVRDWKITEDMAVAIRRQVELKDSLDLRVIGERELLTCSGCGCALKLKIWLPLKSLHIDKEELKQFDQNCWMNTEYNA